MRSSVAALVAGEAPGVISDIACARSPGAARKSVAAAAMVRLRTSPIIEIVLIGFILPLGWDISRACAHALSRSTASVLAAFVPVMKLERVS
jgi:hypothetical protein